MADVSECLAWAGGGPAQRETRAVGPEGGGVGGDTGGDGHKMPENVRAEVSEEGPCVNAFRSLGNGASRGVPSGLWHLRSPETPREGFCSGRPLRGQWRLRLSPDFEIDLGPEGPVAYRLLRAGQRRTISAFLAARSDLRAAQQARLERIVHQMRDSEFGRAHDLSRVHTLDDLEHSAPIRTYADLQPWFDRIIEGQSRVLTREPVRMLLV